MTDENNQQLNPMQRILAAMAVGVTVLSVICFIAFMIVTATDENARETLSSGLWPIVSVTPWLGFPLAFLLIIILIITIAVRRAKGNSSS